MNRITLVGIGVVVGVAIGVATSSFAVSNVLDDPAFPPQVDTVVDDRPTNTQIHQEQPPVVESVEPTVQAAPVEKPKATEPSPTPEPTEPVDEPDQDAVKCS